MRTSLPDHLPNSTRSPALTGSPTIKGTICVVEFITGKPASARAATMPRASLMPPEAMSGIFSLSAAASTVPGKSAGVSSTQATSAATP